MPKPSEIKAIRVPTEYPPREQLSADSVPIYVETFERYSHKNMPNIEQFCSLAKADTQEKVMVAHWFYSAINNSGDERFPALATFEGKLSFVLDNTLMLDCVSLEIMSLLQPTVLERIRNRDPWKMEADAVTPELIQLQLEDLRTTVETLAPYINAIQNLQKFCCLQIKDFFARIRKKVLIAQRESGDQSNPYRITPEKMQALQQDIDEMIEPIGALAANYKKQLEEYLASGSGKQLLDDLSALKNESQESPQIDDVDSMRDRIMKELGNVVDKYLGSETKRYYSTPLYHTNGTLDATNGSELLLLHADILRIDNSNHNLFLREARLQELDMNINTPVNSTAHTFEREIHRLILMIFGPRIKFFQPASFYTKPGAPRFTFAYDNTTSSISGFGEYRVQTKKSDREARHTTTEVGHIIEIDLATAFQRRLATGMPLI